MPSVASLPPGPRTTRTPLEAEASVGASASGCGCPSTISHVAALPGADVAIAEGRLAAAAILERAAQSDLVIMGIQRQRRRRGALGELPLAIARGSDTPLVLISRRPQFGA